MMPAVERRLQRDLPAFRPCAAFSQKSAGAKPSCVYMAPSRFQPDRGFEKPAFCISPRPEEGRKVAHTASRRWRYSTTSCLECGHVTSKSAQENQAAADA